MKDKDQDEHTRPGIPRPGEQPDQEQQPNAPPQPGSRPRGPSLSSQMIPPMYGNPDLDPAGTTHGHPIDLREPNPLTPRGMLYDPRQLLDQQRQGSRRPDSGVPEGARFDPFGPPDPSMVGPGRGPFPSSQFGVPDPDHFQPPGQYQHPNLGRSNKSLKHPGPPGGPPRFPPPGGSGGSPFL